MLHFFHHPKRKTYHHRSTIPRKLRQHFKGRAVRIGDILHFRQVEAVVG